MGCILCLAFSVIMCCANFSLFLFLEKVNTELYYTQYQTEENFWVSDILWNTERTHTHTHTHTHAQKHNWHFKSDFPRSHICFLLTASINTQLFAKELWQLQCPYKCFYEHHENVDHILNNYIYCFTKDFNREQHSFKFVINGSNEPQFRSQLCSVSISSHGNGTNQV